MSTPGADALTFDDLAVDPYSRLAALRDDGAAVWAPRLGMWLVTGHQEVLAVLREPATFTNDSPGSTIQSTLGRQMLSVEGDEQRRYKQACLAPFAVATVRERWRPWVRERCRLLLGRLEEGDRSERGVDLMAGYAAPLALETMGAVVGLDPRDLPEIRSWYQDLAGALANFVGDEAARRRGVEAAERMRRHLDGLVRRPAESGGEDVAGTLVGHLAREEVEAGRLDRIEILANLTIVLFGGIETTESMIGNALWCLFTQPGVRERFDRADPETRDELSSRLVEESLRFEPAVQSLTRHASVDVELGSARIAAGQTVQCMVGAANRDPAVFEEPDRFDLDRPNARRHLSFGLGAHFCLGAELARIEARCAIVELLEHRHTLELDLESSRPPHGHEFRKPPRLVVRARHDGSSAPALL